MAEKITITAVIDPDGLAPMLNVLGDDQLVALVAYGGPVFWIRFTRTNDGTGGSIRSFAELFVDEALTDRVASDTIVQSPPIPEPAGNYIADWEDFAPPPELAGLQYHYGNGGPGGAPGQVVYLWRCEVSNKRLAILAAVENAVDTISVANGYNFNYQKHHRVSQQWDSVRGSMPAILWWPEETQFESNAGVGGGRTARFRIVLLGYYRRSDPDSSDDGSKVLKDMERAMLRAQNGSGDTHYLANAGVEWIDWVGSDTDPYFAGQYHMGGVQLDVVLVYVEKGSEITDA